MKIKSLRSFTLTLVLILSALTVLTCAKPLDVEAFNLKITRAHQKGESWCQSPLLVTLKLVGDRHESKKRTIEIDSSPEAFRDAHIVVTEEGLMDDSVAGVRFEVMLRQGKGDVWIVESAEKTWKCWPGRGHQDYSDKPCQ
jgi:hypothetical protein